MTQKIKDNMCPIRHTVLYGSKNIDFRISRAQRKTLEIAVQPDRSVVVKAPLASSLEEIEKRVMKRSGWIMRQIQYFSRFHPRTPPRTYVRGESHRYLGRSYRLRIERAEKNRVLLKDGYFFIECTKENPEQIQKLLEHWLRQKANEHITQMFEECWNDFNAQASDKPVLKLRKMEKRWGSLTKGGCLTLNTKLVQTPKECIEYVIFHEFCHLLHYRHNKEFYRLLNKTLPDWTNRKRKLEMTLA